MCNETQSFVLWENIQMKILDKNKLTELLDCINDYQAKNGKSPSYRTIMKALKFTNLASVFRYVGRLEADGKIKKTNLGGIEISSNLRPNQPIIAQMVGTVACGKPILAVQNIEQTFELPSAIFGNDRLYCLTAKGDSMTGVGIFNGDLIFYKPCNTADAGEIVVALIEDSATVKTLKKVKGKYILHPENPEYEDIIPEQLLIQGVVKRVVHCF